MEGVDPRDACQQFKIDALKCQELIAKTECLYERRVVLANHDLLVKCVGSAIYGDEEYLQGRSYNDAELNYINPVVELLKSHAIDSQSKNALEKSKRVHYGIVFVFGFKELDRKIFKIPVFKIFLGLNDGYYFFVTIDGKVHYTWETFLYYIGNTRQHFIISYPAEGNYSNTMLFLDVVNLISAGDIECFRDCMVEVNLKNVIRRYSPSNECTMKECDDVDEKFHHIVEKLSNTLGAVDPDRALEYYSKIECFVNSMIFCKILEESKIQWGSKMFQNLKTANQHEVNQAKNNALTELLHSVDEGETYENFKNYWIDHKRLLFLNRNDQYDIFTFKPEAEAEAVVKFNQKLNLTSYIKEVIKDRLLWFQYFNNGEEQYVRITLVKFIEEEDYDESLHKSYSDYVIERMKERELYYMSMRLTYHASLFFYEIFPNNMICFLLIPRLFFTEQNQMGNLEKPLTDTSKNDENDVEMEDETAETDSVNLPDDEKIREFAEKAKREQDFIAKTEGVFNHRLLLKPDEEKLKQFVSLVVLGFEGVENLENDSKKKKELKIINNIVNKIIKENKKFDKHRNLKEEIHYGAVHVIGYKIDEKDEEKKIYKLPVFKIFKKKGDENPIFFDVDLCVYENWDDFLKTNVFPKSWLCVPKNGTYTISKKTNKVKVDFVKTPKYWTAKRFAGVTVSSICLVGSAASFFYTGPIGMGLTLTLPARAGIAGFGASTSVIGLGVSLHKRKISQIGNFVEKYQHSITFVINVSLEVLTVYAEGSVVAGLATGVLTSGAIGIGAYLIIRLTYDAVVKFLETGKVDFADVMNIVNAALLFANGFLKFDSVVKFIKSTKFYQKLRSLKQITSTDKNISNIISVLKVGADVAANPRFESACMKLIKNTKMWWEDKKDWNEFKRDLIIFGSEILVGVLEMVLPILKSFIYKKYKIDVDKLLREKAGYGAIGTIMKYSSKFELFIAQTYKTAKNQRDDIIKAVDENMPNNSNGKVSKMMNEGLKRAKTELSGKLVQDSDDKLEKTIKAENFIESIVLKNEVERLKTCLDDSIKPNEKKIEECIKLSVDGTISQAENLQEKFEEYCRNDENLILLEEDENSKLYVFKYKGEECLNDVVKQVNENFENNLVKIDKNIYSYTNEANNTVPVFLDDDDQQVNENFENNLVKIDKNIYSYTNEANNTVTVFLDDDDPNDVIGYVVVSGLPDTILKPMFS